MEKIIPQIWSLYLNFTHSSVGGRLHLVSPLMTGECGYIITDDVLITRLIF